MARVPQGELDRERLYERLGEKIRHQRSGRAMRQSELAKHLSLSRTSVTNIECGRQGIYVHQLMELAVALNVEPCDLLPSLQEVAGQGQPKYSDELLELVSKLKRKAG